MCISPPTKTTVHVMSAIHKLNAMSRGALVVFEGCDKVGKSTQVKRLLEALAKAGVTNKNIKFPDRSTTIGKQIDAYLRREVELSDRAVHLLFAANRWEVEGQMKSDLHSGQTLVVDRYAYSGVAYTAAKKVAPLWWCKCPDIGIPAPDVVFYLKLPARVAELREEYGDERYEQVKFQQEVEQQFEALRGSQWMELDASRDIESLHKDILAKTLEVICTASQQPIGELWTEEGRQPAV